MMHIGKEMLTVLQLFCGSDEFYIKSLEALCDVRQRRPEKIDSIDVLSKPDKPVDRGLKKVKAPPINRVASARCLPIHQINTFKGWSPPKPYNLVVAVSFGLLVPGRILGAARYGGINVHPSLLPDLRGPAPIVHALLKQKQHTGVTLQTMHPTMFDHGKILAQTEKIPLHATSTPDELLQELGTLGAGLLSRGTEAGLFMQPRDGVPTSDSSSEELDFAPKITLEDRHIDWATWTADEILLRDRVLGELWDTQTLARSSGELPPGKNGRRIAFHGPWALVKDNDQGQATDEVGTPRLVFSPFRKGLTVGFRTKDGETVIPSEATVDGGPRGKGLQLLVAELRNRKPMAAFQSAGLSLGSAG